MKKLLFLMALLICYSTVHAQYMLKVQKKDGTHDLFWVDYTEAVRWENDYIDAYNKGLFLSIYGRQVGSKNTNAQMYPIDQIEQVTVVGTEPKTPVEEQSTFEVDEKTASVNMVNYSIEFGPSAIEDQKTLTVTRVENPTLPEDLEGGINYMATYDFDLEGIHDLNGVVEIRIPASKDSYAAYHNKETGEWDPVLSYYDDETDEMVIISDHLSEYSVFEVTNDHKYNAKIKYKGFDPQVPVDINKVVEKMEKVLNSGNPTIAAIDEFANDEFAKFSLGLEIGVTPLKLAGLDPGLIVTHSENLGKIGTAWSIFQLGNAIKNGDKQDQFAAASKVAFDLVLKPALENRLFAGNVLFPVCMTAVAALDLELSLFATEVHNTATTLYQNAYNKYFERNSGCPSWGGYGYRSAKEWYDLLNPILTDRSMFPDQVTERVEALVTDYITQPWRDADGFNFAISEVRGWWPFWVEITNKDRQTIQENHRKELYAGTLKSVITNINRKYLCKAKDQFDGAYSNYARAMNKVVHLKFSDSSVDKDGKSKYAGCKIKFAEMPDSIKDPERWECTIKENGDADMYFRMYPYLAEGFQPKLVVIDKKEEVIGKIDIKNIQDAGKYHEASFDIGNEEVMFLEDNWDISIKPLVATMEATDMVGTVFTWGPLVYPDNKGFEGLARGIVPGDIYGIYQGITDAFEDRTLVLDEEGNFTIQNNALTMTGNINHISGSGSGKFSLKASSEGRDFVTEEDAFDDWFKYVLYQNGYTDIGRDHLINWTQLEHFDADFTVEGTVEIHFSELMQCFIFTLSGIGSYKFDGAYYSGGSDLYSDYDDDGRLVWKYHSKNMIRAHIYVNDGTFVFGPTLIYH